MGAYYFLYNKTKKVIVYNDHGSWRNDAFCDRHSVMHKYQWDITDKIYSLGGCGSCGSCILKHDENTNAMVDDIDAFYEEMEGRDSLKLSENYLVYHNEIRERNDAKKNSLSDICVDASDDASDDAEILTLDNINICDLQRSSSSEEEEDPTADHAPLWNNNKCIVCGYIFDPKYLRKDIPKKIDNYYMS